jgi:hypothetical protein
MKLFLFLNGNYVSLCRISRTVLPSSEYRITGWRRIKLIERVHIVVYARAKCKTLKMAICSSETSFDFQHTTRRCILRHYFDMKILKHMAYFLHLPLNTREDDRTERPALFILVTWSHKWKMVTEARDRLVTSVTWQDGCGLFLVVCIQIGK